MATKHRHTLKSLFEERVDQNPAAVAVTWSGVEWTRERLDQRANRIAAELISRGVGVESVVGIAGHRSPELLALILGVIKAGAAYVPIAPTLPPSRLQYMVNTCSPELVLATADALPELPRLRAEIVELNAEAPLLNERPPDVAGPDNLAYLIFTSGSTGRPKGVMVQHKAIVNELYATQEYQGPLGDDSVYLQLAPYTFDQSVHEIFWPLCWGAKLVLVVEGEQRNPLRLVEIIREQAVTVMECVPNLLQAALLDPGLRDCESLERVLLGGEALPKAVMRDFFEHRRGATLINGYGPTETAVTVSSWSCDATAEKVSIGKAWTGTNFYLLDGGFRQVPEGADGELFIGGVQVARGYVGRPDLTAERFFPDPFSGVGARMYKSGDIVRRLDDGNLEFLGRSDHQVKIRGFRIELGEIESVLLEHPTVNSCSVVVNKGDRGDQIVAYIVSDEEINPKVLREHVRGRVPTYMVPAHFIAMQAMPLSSSGKIDLRALMAPMTPIAETEEVREPAELSATEAAIAKIWSELLGVDEIARDDDFFELGGHSLLAVQAVSRMRKVFGSAPSLQDFFAEPTLEEVARLIDGQLSPEEDAIVTIWKELLGIDSVDGEDDFFELGGHSLLAVQAVARIKRVLEVNLTLQDFFESSTVRELAEVVIELRQESESAEESASSLQNMKRGDKLVLTPAQKRIWFLEQLAPGTAAYHLPVAERFRGPLDVEAMRQAVERVIERHEVLRTSFPEVGGHPQAVIAPPSRFELPVTKVSGTGPAREQELMRLAGNEFTELFDLTTGPLIRARLFEVAPDDHVLFITAHHIVVDGWSYGLIIRDLATFYNRARGEEIPEPPVLPAQYADYAEWYTQWMQEGGLQEQLAYWEEKLANAPQETALPYCAKRDEVGEAIARDVFLDVSPELSRRIKDLAKRQGVSLYTLLLATFRALLARTTGQHDLCIGTPIANRKHAELESIVGLFLTTQVLRVEVDLDAPFVDVLEREKTTLHEAFANQEAPFEEIVDRLGLDRRINTTPLFSVWYVHESFPEDAREFLDLSSQPFTGLLTTDSKFDLSLYSFERDDVLHLELVFNAELLDEGVVRGLGDRFLRALDVLSSEPDRSFMELELGDLPPGVEPRSPMERPNYPSVLKTIDELRNADPDAIAIRQEGVEWTRQGLHDAALAICNALAGADVRYGDTVALVGAPSFALYASFLGILRYGACFVPISSRLSDNNTAALLDAVNAQLVIRVGQPHSESTWLGRRCIYVDPQSVEITTRYGLGQGPAEIVELPADVARYVYFTSGSTAAQKGVKGTLEALGAFLPWQRETFPTKGPAVCSQLTEIGFDVFLRETLFALTSGHTLAVPARQVGEIDPDDLMRWLESEKVSVVHTVPSLLRAWIAQSSADIKLPELRWIFVVGEPLEQQDIERWRDRFGREVQFVNFYGTTETGPPRCFHRLEGALEGGIQPLGRPTPHTEVLILRDRRYLCGVEEPGEIAIRSPFRTLGYIESENNGSSVFIENPFRQDSDDLVYLTGDRGLYRSDGTVLILGRQDDQVKIRGQRVDPAGVASVLLSSRLVSEATVLGLKDERGETRLAAYAVASSSSVSVQDLREFVRAEVPPFMVPSAFALLNELPRKANGKLDRAALPDPEWQSAVDELFVAPRNPEEEAIAQIWQEVLELETVSVVADFFALGGHSLVAVVVASRLRKLYNIELPLRLFFASPTVRGLADIVREQHADNDKDAAPALKRREPGSPLQLSYQQQRMWFVHRLAPESPAYNVALQRHVVGRLDVDSLKNACAEIFRRHEVVRTIYPERNGELSPEVLPFSPPEIPLEDLAALPALDRSKKAAELTRLEAVRPFDLATGPTLRFRILRLGEEDHVILCTLHHIIGDAWSYGVLWREISAWYNAFRAGERAALAPLQVQYADYAAWQRSWLQGELLDGLLDYWKSHLEDAPQDTALPLRIPRPKIPSAEGGQVIMPLDTKLVRSLRQLGSSTGATLSMVLQAAFRSVLARAIGQCDLTIGTLISNRQTTELESLIGFFVNSLPIRRKVDLDASFSSAVDAERSVFLDAHAHRNAPFELIIDALGIERVVGRTPLFQVLFNYQNVGSDIPSLENLRDVEDADALISARFDLSIVTYDEGDSLTMNFVYREELIDRWFVSSLVRQLDAFLRNAVKAPERPVGAIATSTSAERHQLISHWNREYRDADPRSVTDLVEAQAETEPDAVALELAGDRMSRGELDRRANQIAAALIEAGAGVETVVGITLERSFELVAAILGVLKAGAAFVPLDPKLPAARLEYMIEVAEPVVILSTPEHAAALPDGHSARVLFIDGEEIRGASTSKPTVAADPDSLAYVLFTSGSTGRPKGVMVSRRAIANELISAQEIRGPLGADDAYLQLAPYTFDLSVHEILWPLSAGARLVLLREGEHRDPQRIIHAIVEHRVTIMHPVPSLLRLLLLDPAFARCDTLRRVVPGGEELQLDLMREFMEQLPGVALINSYGPTETGVTVCQWQAAADSNKVAIGLPWLRTQMHLVDAYFEPVPVAVAAELCIGGVQVGRGYAKQPAATAASFVPDPFSKRPGARMYQTGDRARRWPSGNIEFIERIDEQVKLRGFRIELREIEACLLAHEAITDAVVIIDGKGGDARLVAYIVAAPATAASDELRAHLLRLVPEYMVPRVFVRMDALPLNSSGKVSRKDLPEPSEEAIAEEDFQPPATPTEERLAAIWCELLGVERVGRNDDFFELGGHSLLVARLAWEADISLNHIFEAPRLVDLAALVDGGERDDDSGELPALVAGERPEILPLSFAQRRMWFLQQLVADSSAYHIGSGRRYVGALDKELLERAVTAVVARHEALRCCFPAVGGEPRQVVAQSVEHWGLAYDDLSSQSDMAARLEEISRAEREVPFDLEHGPLLRTRLVRLSENEHAFFITVHHIIADGLSLEIFFRDVDELYAAMQGGKAAQLEALDFQYPDYAIWQRSWLADDVLDAQLKHWVERLEGAPEEVSLPLKGPRPAIQTFEGDTVSISLDAATVRGLRRLTAMYGMTLFQVCLAAFRSLLYRYGAGGDVCIGTPVTNRHDPKLESLIGLFVNTIVHRSRIDGTMSFAEVLEVEKDTAVDAYAHQHTPIEQVIERLHLERSLSRNPLFQVMFQLLQFDEIPRSSALEGIDILPLERTRTSTQLDLDVSGLLEGDELQMSWVYNVALFERATIAALARDFAELLRAVIASPAARVCDLPLLGPEQIQRLITHWNQTATELGSSPIHRLIGETAASRASEVAIEDHAGALTYGELEQESDGLAALLLEQGVGPEERVAISLSRSRDLIIASLAVVKAGASYLPIDPKLPIDRIRYMTEDSAVRFMITDSGTGALAASIGVESIGVDQRGASAPQLPTVDSEQLAYTLYTSGSTGRPKSVQITHRSLVNFLAAMKERPGFSSSDVLLAVTTTSFDISGLELYLPLLVGGKVVIATGNESRDPALLSERIVSAGATVMQATPSTWRSLIDVGWQGASGLKALCGGEALPADLAEALVPLVDELWNMYGPTETTIWSSCQHVQAGSAVRLGAPIANTELYVVSPDQLDQLQPLDVPGELLIGGAGLARGYGMRPDLTAERFIPDPYSGRPGGRVYRTGDLVRRSQDGELEYFGRMDSQVKLRGFRIELGEIEAALRDHSGIRDAVVTIAEVSSSPTLVAYVIAASAEVPDSAALQSALSESLPDYMVPRVYMAIDHIPLSAAGKVDRKALPEPTFASKKERTGPRNEIEDQLLAIWSSVLGRDELGVTDDFFELGGQSLLGAKLIWEVNQSFGSDLNLDAVFLSSTITEMAKLVERQQAEGRRDFNLVRTDASETHAMVRQDIHYQFVKQEPYETLSRVTFSYELRGTLDKKLLRFAVDDLIRCYSSLRTVFDKRGDEVYQRILPYEEGAGLDWGEASIEESDLQAEFDKLIGLPIEIENGPLVRARVLELEPERYVFLLLVPHISADLQSQPVLIEGLESRYRASVRAGAPVPGAAEELRFIDYAEAIRRFAESQEGQTMRAEWNEAMETWPAVELPLDHPRESLDKRRAAARLGVVPCETHVVDLVIPNTLRTSVVQVARQERSSAFIVLFTALAEYVRRRTGESKFCASWVYGHRHMSVTERMVGVPGIPIPSFLDVREGESFSSSLKRATEAVRWSSNRGLIEVRPHHRLERIGFNFVYAESSGSPGSGALELGPEIRAESTRFAAPPMKLHTDLLFQVTDRGNEIVIYSFWNSELFELESSRKFMADFREVLAELVVAGMRKPSPVKSGDVRDTSSP